jgi:co-chaperonin GroES (HSP10)
MIKPVGRRALIEQEKEVQTKSGLIIPGGVDKRPIAKGTIVAVWESKVFKVGDVVYFKKWAVDELEIDGVKHSFIKTKDILARIE